MGIIKLNGLTKLFTSLIQLIIYIWLVLVSRLSLTADPFTI